MLTHRHRDHSAGAPRLAELTGAPVRAVDPAQRLGDEGLAAGDVLTQAGCELRVIATPGHTDRLGLPGLPADGAVLTGDTVLGRGTTVIARDGSLGDYLGSLRRLRALADETELRALLPGHGPLLARPAETLDYYLAHRAERLDEVRAALAAGDTSPGRDRGPGLRGRGPGAVAARRVVGPGPADYLAARGEVPPGVTW